MSSGWRASCLGLLFVAGCHGGSASPAPVTEKQLPVTEKQLNHELTFTLDPDTRTWRTFRARPGARIPADGIWYRYAPFLGIPPEALVPVRPPRPHPIVPGAVLIDYQQMHLGYPVAGGGYSIAVKDGLLRDGLGKVVTDLPVTLPAPISRERAAEIAFARIEPKGARPWLAQPGRWKPPSQDLVLSSPMMPARGRDFQLVWFFSFSSTGISEPGTVTIDAVTGAVMATTPNLIH
jgi:hypothetical protein